MITCYLRYVIDPYTLADYERYRTAVREDETALAAWRYQAQTRCIVSFERSFMRPMLT